VPDEEYDLRETIATNAAGPAEARSDNSSAKQHSLQDQIAADKYLRSQQAAATTGATGLRFMRLVPPGIS
jgi:hypothetical protein